MTPSVLEPAPLAVAVDGGGLHRAPRRRRRMRPGLARFLLIRLALIPVSVFVVVVISFFLIALIPSSTAQAIAGNDATAERVAQINAALGLDKPIWEQFTAYLSQLARLDLGSSFYTQRPVLDEILERIPATLELAVPAFLISVVLGITLGTWAAFHAGRVPDRVERSWSTIFNAIPEFLLGVVAIYVVFFLLRLVPAPTGRIGISDAAPPRVTGLMTVDSLLTGEFVTFGHAVQYLALPTLVLGISGSVAFARLTRAALSDSLNSPFIEYARSIGLPTAQIVRYALTDIRTPVLTYVAIAAAYVLGGSALIEILFSWPGFGAWGITGMGQLDAPVIRAYVLVAGVASLLAYLVLDVVAVVLDPRISISHDR